MFLLLGLGLLSPFLWVLYRTVSALGWPSVPCLVLESGVREHSGDDGSTWSVAIEYQYQFGGALYRSSRYTFLGGSSSGRRGKERIVARYPRGARVRCFVNPRRPDDAVLRRAPTWPIVFGLIPLTFVVLGVAGLRRFGSTRRQPLTAAGTTKTAARRPRVPVSGGRAAREQEVLRARQGPRVGAAVAALIVVPPTIAAALMWDAHDRVLAALAVLLLLLAAAAWAHLGYRLLALRNPRPDLVLRPGVLRPGEAARLDWRLRPQSSSVERLELVLRGSERVSYRRGTDTHTESALVVERPLATAEGALRAAMGSCEVVVPAGAMHSFAGENNQFVWSIEVRGRVALLPDLGESMEIEVAPATPAPPAGAVAMVPGAGCSPGSTIELALDWQLDEPPEALVVRLFWYTDGKGDRDLEVIASQPVEPPRQAGSGRFRFTLLAAPWSYSGTLFSLSWGVELVASPRGECRLFELVVAPDGRERGESAGEGAGP